MGNAVAYFIASFGAPKKVYGLERREKKAAIATNLDQLHKLTQSNFLELHL